MLTVEDLKSLVGPQVWYITLAIPTPTVSFYMVEAFFIEHIEVTAVGIYARPTRDKFRKIPVGDVFTDIDRAEWVCKEKNKERIEMQIADLQRDLARLK